MRTKTLMASMVVLLLTAAPALADSGNGIGSVCTATARISPDNQTVPETTNGAPTIVKLNGSPSLPSNATSYSWVQTSGPTVALDNASVRQPSFAAPSVGPTGATLTFRLTVTGCDPIQANGTTTTINVTNVVTNQPPVAVATVSPSSVYEGTFVTMDGTPSTDPDNNPLTYSWTQVSGPAVTFISNSGAIATFNAPTDVPYPSGASLLFRLTVSDGSLSSSTDKIVNVQWVNEPPVAKLSCPATVDERASLSLAGTGSSDSDDGIASYAWTQLMGVPNAELPAYDPASAVNISFAAPSLTSRADTMTFKLVVTDNGGLSNSAECAVKVLDITPPAITNVPANQTAEATSAAGAMVSYIIPTASDLVDGTVSVTCVPTSGSTFALGTSTIVCSAADKAGNAASANFAVTVKDTTPPTMNNVPTGITTIATSVSGAAMTFNPTATDLVDGSVAVTCLPASGSTFSLGTTVVMCSAIDAHNNSAKAAPFNVTVNYGFNGLLSPYDSSKAYKIKSAIPIKWQYTSGTGAVLPSSAARPNVVIYQVSNGVDSPDAIGLDDAGNSGYQYDSTSNTWQFNWKTTGLTAGTYDVYIQSGMTGQKNGPFKVQLSK